MLKILIRILLPLLISGCSLYESPGRKFLENNAYQFANGQAFSATNNKAYANLVACNRDESHTTWVLLDKNVDADTFAFEGERYELRVRPTEDSSISCYYTFNSAQDMYEKVSSARELTIALIASPHQDSPPPKARQ